MKAPLVRDEEYAYTAAHRPFSLAWLLAERGACDEARTWALRLLAFSKERGMPFAEGRGHWVLAEVLRRAGDLDAADAEIQTALAVLGEASPVDLPGAFATLAALRLAQGRTAEALRFEWAEVKSARLVVDPWAGLRQAKTARTPGKPPRGGER